MNQDGTRTMQSWSHFDTGDANEVLRATLAMFDELSRQAHAE